MFDTPLHGALAHDYRRYVLAKEFGWTLETIDRLSMRDFQVMYGLITGIADGLQRERDLRK
ncbi:MAG: hypothetical protein JW910_05350 [Anaerolineae bacterium]|nr:hypothetical protein [Anaerolineae bacterium]